jgi:tetratricopeptide (TPR) repeat protein
MADIQAFLERANMLIEQGRHKEAQTWVKKVLEQEPENDYALSVLARSYINGKEYDKGIETVNKAIAICPEESHYFYLLGFAYYQKNDHIVAISQLNKAIELNPYQASYYGLLAFIHLEENRFELALEKANEGLEIDPENITCLNARSKAQNKLKMTDEAIATMQNALQKDPDNEFTHATVGWNLLEKGKHKEAKVHFREALRIDPEYHNAKVGLKESLKSVIPPYRWLLQFSFWMNNKSKTFRWVFVISLLVGVRVIASLSKENSETEKIGMVVAGAYFLFVGASWILNPLANVFLLFHKDGKHALERSEKWNAVAFLVCILSGISIIVLSSFLTNENLSTNLVISGLIVTSLAIPTGHMNFPIQFKGNRIPQWIAMALIAMALLTIMVVFTGLADPVIFFTLYLILFAMFTWASM